MPWNAVECRALLFVELGQDIDRRTALEQRRKLRHQADLAPQLQRITLAHVNSGIVPNARKVLGGIKLHQFRSIDPIGRP